MKAKNRMTELAGDMVPIFADPEREYCYLSRVQRYRRIEGGARFSVLTNDDEEMTLDVRFVSPQVVRVRCYRPGEEPPVDSPMLVDGARRTANVNVRGRRRAHRHQERRPRAARRAAPVSLRRLRPPRKEALRPADRRRLVPRPGRPPDGLLARPRWTHRLLRELRTATGRASLRPGPAVRRPRQARAARRRLVARRHGHQHDERHLPQHAFLLEQPRLRRVRAPFLEDRLGARPPFDGHGLLPRRRSLPGLLPHLRRLPEEDPRPLRRADGPCACAAAVVVRRVAVALHVRQPRRGRGRGREGA